MDRTFCVIDDSSSLGSVILGAGSKSVTNLTDRFEELFLLLLVILLTSRSSAARLTRLPHLSDDERNAELSPPDECNDELSVLYRLLVLDDNIVCVVAVV